MMPALNGTLFLALSLVQREHSSKSPDPTPGCLFGQLEDMGPHLKMTPLREATPQDRERADEIVKSLKKSLKKYADHEVALREGYRIFLPRVPLPEHHFTNYAYAAREAFDFDVEQPSSLLYRKKGDDYELAGAMFAAPLGVGLEELDRRVPLSVARWHLHTNVCLPPEGEGRKMLEESSTRAQRERSESRSESRGGGAPRHQAKSPRFGLSPQASIASEAECAAEGGRFHYAVFGWMVHVYPFEDDPEAVFRHPNHHDHGKP